MWSQQEKGIRDWANKECWRGNAVQVVWVREENNELVVHNQRQSLHYPSSAKTIDVPHGMACSIFALSQSMSIMLVRLLHEHFADTSAMEECKDCAGNNRGLVALFCHNNLKMDEQHSWPIARTDDYGYPQPFLSPLTWSAEEEGMLPELSMEYEHLKAE